MPTKTHPKNKSSVRRSPYTGRLLPDRPAHRSSTAEKANPQGESISKTITTMIKMGSKVRDTATGLEGTVVLYQISMDMSRCYLIQPKALDKETGQPVKALWMVPTRLAGDEVVPEPPMPFEVLGTQVEDEPTGFTGTAIELILFMSGCVHVQIQPKGKLEKSGDMIVPRDFDIRRLKGKAVPRMTDIAKEQDQAEKPSPMAFEHNERAIPAGV